MKREQKENLVYAIIDIVVSVVFGILAVQKLSGGFSRGGITNVCVCIMFFIHSLSYFRKYLKDTQEMAMKRSKTDWKQETTNKG